MALPDTILPLPCREGTPTGAPIPGGLSNQIWRVQNAGRTVIVRLGRDYPVHQVDRARARR